MKVVLTSLAALAVATTSAFAADLPSRAAPPVFVPPPPIAVFSWTGFYFGGNAGYTFNNRRDYTLSDPTGVLSANVNTIRPGFVSDKRSGFTGGLQVGYNYEFGAGPGGGIVVGVEADAAYTGIRDNFTIFDPTGFYGSSFASRTDYVGTGRGRLGYAFGDFLVYGTGGFAFGGVRDNFAFSNGGIGAYAGGNDKIRTGYSYGGGVEYAIPTGSFLNFFNSSAVTLKAEYIHYDLGSSNILVGNINSNLFIGTGYVEHVRYSGDIVRGGINFKFGSPLAAPVVARY